MGVKRITGIEIKRVKGSGVNKGIKDTASTIS
jgi:hypothetical protein